MPRTSVNVLVMMVALLVGVGPAVAQDDDDRSVTTTATYPPRKLVSNELRTLDDVQLGSVAPPAVTPTPRLYLLHEPGARPALRIDDQPNDPTPVLIDDVGRVGIGTLAPEAAARLDVAGAASVAGDVRLGVHVAGNAVTQDGAGTMECVGCVDALDVKSSEVQLRADNDGRVDNDANTDSGCNPGEAVQEIREDGTLKCVKITRKAR